MTKSKPFQANGLLIVTLIALGLLLFHCYFNNRYGYFRDEFDYLSCGNHLAWGYVDQPPLLPFLVRMSRTILADSLRSIRFLPALAISMIVVLTAMIAREFGGRRFSLILSAVTIVVAPMYLSDGSLLTTNCLEPLLWMGCVYFAILALTRDARYWLGFGVVAGLGLEEKYSIAVFGFGIVVGLLLTKERRALLSKWFWFAGAAAFLIFLPNLIWNIQNHFPFLELMHNIRADGRDVQLSPFEFFAQQILLIHPLNALIWIAGLFGLFFFARFKQFRFLGWCYLVSFTAFVVLKGKNYYLAPMYPMLLAAALVMNESNGRSKVVEPALIVLLLAGGHGCTISSSGSHCRSFHFYMDTRSSPRTEHGQERSVLLNTTWDQFGWEELTARTAEAWARLTRRRNDCRLRSNYGQAGAIDFFWRVMVCHRHSADIRHIFLGDTRLLRQLHDWFDDTRRTRQTFRTRRTCRHLPQPHALERTSRFYLQGSNSAH